MARKFFCSLGATSEELLMGKPSAVQTDATDNPARMAGATQDRSTV